MQSSLLRIVVLTAALGFSSSAPALEKTAARFEGRTIGDWEADIISCSLSYYNICTGWIWIWSGFEDGEILGTVYDSCCPVYMNGVVGSYLYYWTGAVPGYGFTGTHAVYGADSNDCLVGGAVAYTPWLPTSGWNFTSWGGYVLAPVRFIVTATIRDAQGFGTPVALPSDGPSACGLCFPTTRTTHSYFWGLETSPTCPGSPLYDGSCFVEWLAVAQAYCGAAVEDESWGGIKSLYR